MKEADNEGGVRQLALPFDEPDHFAADDFIEAPSNHAARAALASPVAWVNRRLVLWGDSGCGKTHLARIWAGETGADVVMAGQLREPASSPAPALLIEDIETIAAPVALLATLERAAFSGGLILMTSRTPPARLSIAPADLASRLRASLTIRIEAAEPALLDALLVRLAAARQLALPAGLADFLLSHLPRRPAVMREAIARLDRYSLALGTAPSRRIAERLIAELAGLPECAPSPSRQNGVGERPAPQAPSML